jgi:hypothetical protein
MMSDLTPIQAITYADAETRGRLRAWKQKLAKDYSAYDSRYRQARDSHNPAIGDLVEKRGIGRQRAFEKIARILGPSVTFEWSDLTAKRPIAVWSILMPRQAVVTHMPEGTPEKEVLSRAQNCVCLHCIVAGFLPGSGSDPGKIGVTDGVWTIEVPDHALGRAVQRSRFLHPGVIIREAHTTLLDLPVTVLERTGFKKNVLVKAGAGCFGGYFSIGQEIQDGSLHTHFRASTWLENDQLRKDQIPLCEKGVPGERLSDSWLRPFPLNCIADGSPNGHYRCHTWDLNENRWQNAASASAA